MELKQVDLAPMLETDMDTDELKTLRYAASCSGFLISFAIAVWPQRFQFLTVLRRDRTVNGKPSIRRSTTLLGPLKLARYCSYLLQSRLQGCRRRRSQSQSQSPLLRELRRK